MPVMPTIREALIKRLGGFSEGDLTDRSYESYRHGYNDGGEDEPPSGTTARFGYRRQTTSGLRDFTLIDPEQVLQIIWVLFQSNPVIKRAAQIKRDYILGRGVFPQTGDDDLMEILEKFWEINSLEERQKEFTLQLFLFGEQCYPAFVRESDGRAKLGYIDPGDIQMVITDPENALEQWAVVVKPVSTVNPWEKPKDTRVYRIIRVEEKEQQGDQWDQAIGFWEDNSRESVGVFDPERSNTMEPYQDDQGTSSDFLNQLFGVEKEGDEKSYVGKMVTAEQATIQDWEKDMLNSFGLTKYSGSCFFFRVNSVSNQPRGSSDFLQVADWADQHDQTLFDLADREQLASFFSWDVTLKGVDRSEVRKYSKDLSLKPPKKGSLNIHNDEEEWVMSHPEVGATNSIETSRALQLQVLGGLGFPEHWFGKGDETNRATAQAQGDPTWKTLEHDQGVVQTNLIKILRFVRDQAIIAGMWEPTRDEKTGEDIDNKINLNMPDMTSKDTSIITSAIANLSSSLVVAQEQGWIDSSTAREIFAKAVLEMDIEIDLSEELPPPEEVAQQNQGQGFGMEEKTYQNSHGVMLPDSETSGSESWSGLSMDNKKELVRAAIERIGYKVSESDELEEFIEK